MTRTRSSNKRLRGRGSHLNGKDLLIPRGVSDKLAGIHLRDFGLSNISADHSGFYLASNAKVGVVKLGKSDGGRGRGLRSRVLSLSRHWGGDVKLHDLRVFPDSPELRARPTPLTPWMAADKPRYFAKRFELEVKRALGNTRKEFYKPGDLAAIISAIAQTLQDNEGADQPAPTEEVQEQPIFRGHRPTTRSRGLNSSTP